MPPVDPVNHAAPIVKEGSRSPKAEAPRTREESQVGLEERAFSSRDNRDQGRIAGAPDTPGYDRGAKLEDECASSEDGLTLDLEAR